MKLEIKENDGTLSSVIAQRIIDKLVSGEFAQGAPVRESKLAQELKSSRNVVREALSLIVGMGILEYVPYCGYRTKTFTMHDVLEWYEIRESVEPIACRRLAMQRPRELIERLETLLKEQKVAFAAGDYVQAFQLDGDFHLEIIRNCGNRLFFSLTNSGFISIAFLFKNQILTEHRDGKRLCHFNDDDINGTICAHTLILDAIRGGDSYSAETQARVHAGIQVRNLEQLIQRDRTRAAAPLALADILAAGRSNLQWN